MKKRILSIVLAMGMVAALLAGCGSSAPAEEAPAEEAAAEEAAPAEDAAPAEESGEGDLSALKIGALLTLTENDGGWCQAQSVGLHKAIADLGMSEDQLIVMETIEEEQVTVSNVVEQLVEEGCNIIMGCSTGYSPILSDLAGQYPDVQFVQVGAPNANLICYQIRDYEGMYLLGYAAACLSEVDTLGYSAGMSEASVRRGVNAFALGAAAKNPNATVQVVWANSWYDPEAETECANSLLSQGITHLGINASSPAIPQACEKAGSYCFGYHCDMSDYAPDAVVFSYVWNWAPIMEDIWTKVAAASAPYEDAYFWGAEYDCPQISAFAEWVPQEVQDEVLQVQADMKAGKINVYYGGLKDNEGNVLVEGDTMEDEAIMTQEFLVENVIGTWK